MRGRPVRQARLRRNSTRQARREQAPGAPCEHQTGTPSAPCPSHATRCATRARRAATRATPRLTPYASRFQANRPSDLYWVFSRPRAPRHAFRRLIAVRRHRRPQARGQRRDDTEASLADQGRTGHGQDHARRRGRRRARHAVAAVAYQVHHQGPAGSVRIRRRLAARASSVAARRARARARKSATTSSRACCGRHSSRTSKPCC